MITGTQLRAARQLLCIDQRRLAELSGLSVPTIRPMEGCEKIIHGNIDSLIRLVNVLTVAGIELVVKAAVGNEGGRGVRLKQ